MSFNLESIKISDDDIDWVEDLLKINFDEDRRRIIKSLESRDVQAFPGTGKTTLLVGKLAILARKWNYSNCGICVLSHTNVAREEIEERLGKTEEGSRLLSYPHFIGTLHSFFDSFVSIPWLRSQGIKINLVDNEIVLRLRWGALDYKQKYAIEHKYKGMNVCQYKDEIGAIDISCKGKIGNAVEQTIKESQLKGYFTFDEMLLYAKKALTTCPIIGDGLKKRFPLVFIDEAQDTNSLQWKLIQLAFCCGAHPAIIQGYGDHNQAIFDSALSSASSEFPRNNYFVLNNSHRFDDVIAEFANSICEGEDKMVGIRNEFTEKKLNNTIFLFSDERISEVVNEFGKLILESFSDDELNYYSKLGCHVIGLVHNRGDLSTHSHFPKGIYDYWTEYDSQRSPYKSRFDFLIDYIRAGQVKFRNTGEVRDFIDFCAKGMRRLLNLAANDNFILPTNNQFSTLISKLQPCDVDVVKEIFKKLMIIDTGNKVVWNKGIEQIVTILKLYNLDENTNVRKFCEWSNVNGDLSSAYGKISPSVFSNCCVFKNGDRQVNLEFGSIHSVKGRTHLATLVVETYTRGYAIASLLDYMCGKKMSKSSITYKAKCQYVAMTRARALLCLAIPETLVSEEQCAQLSQQGWNIKRI